MNGITAHAFRVAPLVFRCTGCSGRIFKTAIDHDTLFEEVGGIFFEIQPPDRNRREERRMSVEISRRFSNRLLREPDLGQMRDGAIRYLTMRPDALMGLFAYLPPEMRDSALAALSRSVTEHGGRSVRAYVESGAASPQTLIATLQETAADLGWGVWEFAPSIPSAAGRREITVTVRNSPFAEAAFPADRPMCAPIHGMLNAVAPYLLGQNANVQETQCSAHTGHGICHFVMSS